MPKTGPRRRVTVAESTVRRIAGQRSRLATATAATRGPREELAVVVDVLRSAAAPGAHQISQASADRLVSRVVEQARTAVDELHARQQRRAERTLTNSPQSRRSA